VLRQPSNERQRPGPGTIGVRMARWLRDQASGAAATGSGPAEPLVIAVSTAVTAAISAAARPGVRITMAASAASAPTMSVREFGAGTVAADATDMTSKLHDGVVVRAGTCARDEDGS
jgi:hypothetical protein